MKLSQMLDSGQDVQGSSKSYLMEEVGFLISPKLIGIFILFCFLCFKNKDVKEVHKTPNKIINQCPM